jgi:hydroxypyruvate isomerase
MTFKYSITLSSFWNLNESLERTLERLIHQNYDAVEMFGEPYNLDLKSLKEIFCSFDLPVCGITGMWGPISEEGRKRNLLSSNNDVLAYSEEYVKECVKMCHLLGGYEVNVCLFADDEFVPSDRNHTLIPQDQKLSLIQKIAIPTLSRLAKFASDYGIELLLEPLNRYSTPYCTTAKEAIEVANQINQPLRLRRNHELSESFGRHYKDIADKAILDNTQKDIAYSGADVACRDNIAYRDFPFVRVAKGKTNFPCAVKDDFIKNGTYECGSCVSYNVNECYPTAADYGPCMRCKIRQAR